jgi:hypothetical protein
LQKNLLMANRIASAFGLTPGAWQFDDDTENLFPERSPMENLEDAASGARDIQPRKYLKDRHQGKPTEPLIVLPQYSGDFLDKLRAEFKNKNADSLQDFTFPDERTKYLPNVVPRDLTDEWYDINRPGEGAGYTDLKQYHDRGWDEEDAPEVSEDKILRMRNFNKALKCPCLNPVKPGEAEELQAQMVLARFLMQICPRDFEINPQQVRVAKMLRDFEQSLIYTKSNGWRKPNDKLEKGISVRLSKAEPGVGRWSFSTSSGGDSYITIFQFIPSKGVLDPKKLHVRVSCTCPSWVYWGAQFNAVMGDYLYGKVEPKFAPPKVRDPYHRFLVCKHVLACIPYVSNYKLKRELSPETKQKLKKAPKYELGEKFKEDKIRIPTYLRDYENKDEIKDIVDKWDRMPSGQKRDSIMGLDDPDAVAFMAYKFPKEATPFVIKKLKDMAVKDASPGIRTEARRMLGVIT